MAKLSVREFEESCERNLSDACGVDFVYSENMFLLFWQKTKFCCGNDESDDCVETASNCVDLWPIPAHREGSDRRV